MNAGVKSLKVQEKTVTINSRKKIFDAEKRKNTTFGA